MKAHVLSRRNRAVGFAIAVSIIMLGAAALASAGAALAPMSPPGGASASSTTTTLPASFAGSSSGQTYTVSLVGSSVAVGSFPSPTPSQAAQGSAASAGSSFLEPFASDLTISVAPTSEGPYDVGEAAGTLTATLDFTGSGTVAVEWWSSTTSATCGDSSYADTGTSGLTLIPDTSASGATYYCAIATETGGLGSIADSNSVDIIVNADPAVSVTPVGPLTYDVGQSASPGLTATVDYSGPNTVAVEWWASTSSSTCGDMSYTDTAISGDSFTPNTAASGTTYYCAIATETGGAGTVADSNSVEITVNADPTVSVAPVGPLTYDVGQSASPGLTATVTYSGSNTVSVEWWSSTSSAVCGDLSYTDTGTSGLTLVPDTSAPGTTYYCAIATETGGAGTVADSNSVEITVNADPTVSVTPTGPLSYDVGQTAGTLTASVAYLGSNTVSVEWWSSTSSAVCGDLSYTDTGTSGLTLVPDTSAPGTTYYCAIATETGGAGTVADSNSVEITVNADPTVSVAPVGPLTYDVGQSASPGLTATVTYSGSNTVSVEWWSSTSSAVCGDLSYTDTGTSGLTLVPDTSAPGTTYYCAIATETGGAGTVADSNSVEITVNADPTVSVAPVGPLTYDVGQSASPGLTATVTYSGSNTVSVEWWSSTSSAVCGDLSYTDTGTSGLTLVPDTSAPGTTYYCAIATETGGAGTVADSNSVEITVNADPTVSVTPTGPLSYDVGQTAGTLTASVAYLGSNTVSVEWYSSGISTCNAGSTDTTHSGLTFTPSTVSTGTTYYCAVVSDSGVPGYSSPSNALGVTVNPALVAGGVTPDSPTYDVGQTATLAVNPSAGTSPYSYQWYSSAAGTGACDLGVSISGATDSTYGAPTGSAGTTYYCYVVTDSATTPTSIGSTWDKVTVNSALVAGGVTPGTPAYDVGQTATLTSHPSLGTIPYTYQWYSSAAGTGACDLGASISGATDSTYGAPTGSAGTTYYCYVVTDSATTPTSIGSTWDKVTVNSALVAGGVTPGTPAYDVGQTATLTSHPSLGTIPYTYQWYSSAAGTGACDLGASISGATDSTYGAPTGSAGTTYYCYVVTDSASTPTSIGSGWDLVTVNQALAAGAVTPGSPTYDVGQTATLASHASSGTGSYTYQWYSSATGSGACDAGTSISGATGNTYGAPTGSAGTTYYCYVVTDSATTPTSAESAWDLVTVNQALAAGAVTPGSPTYDVGQTATLTSHASLGTTSYSYQWYSSTTGAGICSSGSPITGATNSAFGPPTGSAGTTYYCYVVTDSASTPTSIGSGWDLVTVNQALAAGAVTPGSPTYDVGQTATLTSHPSLGTIPYTYQWYSSATGSVACNAGTSISGATGNTYGAPTGSAGTTYYCYVVTDSASTPTSIGSGWDLVTVNQALAAGAVTPGSPTYDVGQTATLTSHPSLGTIPYTYQWYSSAAGTGACDLGASISGATGNTYGAPTGSAGTTYYCYVVTDSATTPTSIGSTWDKVTVNSALVAGGVTPGTPAYDVGQTATLTSHPSLGTIPYTYQWYSSAIGSVACNAGTSITGATSAHVRSADGVRWHDVLLLRGDGQCFHTYLNWIRVGSSSQ